MSTNQENPFKRPGTATLVEGPPPSSNKKVWLIGCGAVILLGMLVCCGGVAYFAAKGPEFLAQAVDAAMAQELRTQLASDPIIEQQIGEIESLSFDFSQTIENAQKASQTGTQPQLAFRIKGSNGEGVLLIEQDSSGSGGGAIRSGTLVMSDGSEFPLDVSNLKPSSPKTGEMEFDDLIDEGESFTPTESLPDENRPIELQIDGSVPQR